MIKSHWRHRIGGVLLVLLLTSLCATAQRGSQPATVKVESKTGTITGRVVNENGQPHVNVEVRVRPDTPEGLPVTNTTTNRDGVFKLSGLERGSYYVSVTVPAHIPKSLDAGPVVFKAGDPVTLVLMKGGVVTGTVTDTKGDPVVGIGVRVSMVSDESGRRYGDAGRYYENMTDDRGVYRVYGLPTGTYVVSTDGSVEDRSSLRIYVNGFAKDLPTYAPSSNRAGADEVSVRIGEEVSDVNIRYRGERGSTISGIVNGLPDDDRGISVALSSIGEGGPRFHNQSPRPGRDFIFEGIPDGDYHLAATGYVSDRTRKQSESVFLKVRGADIEGLELTVAALAAIKGRVVLEPLKAPPPECADKRQPQFSEISVSAWHRVTEGAKKKPQFVWRAGGRVTPNAEGNLTFSDVAASEYYFAMQFSAQQWFLQSIAFASPAPNGEPIDVTRTWTTVKPGDQLSGLTFTLAQGAGSINGEISLAEGQTLPEKTFAFLVPAEPERADDVLRYVAVPVNSDGRFWLKVAPGRYWMLAQHGTDDTRYEVSKVRLPDGSEIRSSLRHAAEKAKTEIEIKPCQEVNFRLPL
jgi:Carboxypeptidase regulatory-like domain